MENTHTLLDANPMVSILAHITAWKTPYLQLFKMHSGAGSLGQMLSRVLLMTNALGQLGTYVLPFPAHWESTMNNPTPLNRAIKQMV
jgi:hypothetical protein